MQYLPLARVVDLGDALSGAIPGAVVKGKELKVDWWKRVSSPFQEFGWLAGSLYVVDRLLGLLSPRLRVFVYEFMVQPIGGKPLLPAGLSKGLTFEEIGRGHPDVALMPATDEIKRLRFAQNARCLGTYRRGELIGYLWFCRDRYEEDEVRCTYVLAEPSASIFDFDLFVMPKHRLGIGFLGVWHGANQMLAPQGIRYTFSRLTRFNTASRRAHAHLGWKRAGSGVFLKFWEVEIMFATLAPYIAFTHRSDQRVTLRLSPRVLSSAVPAQPGISESP
jgi:hypothetical protein